MDYSIEYLLSGIIYVVEKEKKKKKKMTNSTSGSLNVVKSVNLRLEN